MRNVIAVLCFISTVAAHAQTVDPNALREAVAACGEHQHVSGGGFASQNKTVSYNTGYENCPDVMKQQTEASAARRATAQKANINAIATQLKGVK